MVVVYKDIFTGHELISDSYELEEKYEGCAYFVKSQKVTEEALDLGIETEDGDDQAAEGERVNNIVHFFNYTETTYKKKEYMTYIKGYMKKVLSELEGDEEKSALFKSQAQNIVKYVLANIKEIDFYSNQDGNEDGMVIPGVWTGEEGPNDGPTMIYFTHGLKGEKY